MTAVVDVTKLSWAPEIELEVQRYREEAKKLRQDEDRLMEARRKSRFELERASWDVERQDHLHSGGRSPPSEQRFRSRPDDDNDDNDDCFFVHYGHLCCVAVTFRSFGLTIGRPGSERRQDLEHHYNH
ncbi:hypothetical protein BGW39_008791 [Mortierella sp. 14UC]|nr:hypothetical protein BGW39_008791 [Mortierella sp. 14UC]